MAGRKLTLGELKKPFDVKNVKVDGIVKFDIDNAYPQRMERIIDESVSSKSAAQMLGRFITGLGFVDKTLNDIVVGEDRYSRPVKLYKILTQISRAVAYHYGFYIRLQYNGELKVNKMRVEPFTYCRLGEMDGTEYSGKVVVYNNWDKSQGPIRRNEYSQVDIYNPRESVILERIEKAGGIDKWKGQMFFWFGDDQYIYPVSLIDPVQYDADTERQISMFKNGELRRGFFLKYILHHTEFETEQDADEFKEVVEKMMGGDHDLSFMVLEGTFNEEGQLIQGENIKVEKIEQNINDKLFESYESSTINSIRKAFNAIPQILIDYEDGKLGTTSGEALSQAANFYNAMTDDIRKQVSESIKEIMSNWHKEDLSGRDFTIEPLNFGTNDSTLEV
jgi:hypothetical protein